MPPDEGTATAAPDIDVAKIVEQLGRAAAALQIAANPALTYSPQTLADALQISKSQVMALDRTGKLPRPIALSERCPRWPADEIRAWLAAGAPSRLDWQAMKATVAARSRPRA